MNETIKTKKARLELSREDNRLKLVIKGRLDNKAVSQFWQSVTEQVSEDKPGSISIDTSEIDYCDGAGLGLLFWLRLQGKRKKIDVNIEGLADNFQNMLDMFDAGEFAKAKRRRRKPVRVPEEIGKSTVQIVDDTKTQISFVGELCATLFSVFRHPRQFRWKNAFYISETAGVNSVGIIVLIGFLFGLILAFSGIITLEKYGAQIYVANMVSIALVRVLGPFITAVMLTGRSGSAFAAEIGTMKINEEIDAMVTMGISPMRFLVAPRVLAMLVMTPLLSVIANLSGLIGAAVVLLPINIALTTYINRVQGAVDLGDFFGGLFKSVVYGLIIGAVGCIRGLQTKTGPSAVGDSTTQAVVSSIILIVIAEGIFAVLFYCLGI